MEDQKELINKITHLSQYQCVDSCQVIIDDKNIINKVCLSFEINPAYYYEIQKMIEDEDSGVFDELLDRLKISQTTFEIHMNYIFQYPNMDESTRIEIIFKTSCAPQQTNQWLKIMHENVKIVDEMIDFYVNNC